MKNFSKIVILSALVITFFTACSGSDKKRNANFLEPMTIEIADEIQSDAALVEVIQSSEKAMNEFSDNIEQLAIDGEDLLKKSESGEEASVMDQLKAGKLMLEFASNSTQMITSMEKFESYVSSQKEQGTISDAQLKALEQVGTAFKVRIEQIETKYKDYFDR